MELMFDKFKNISRLFKREDKVMAAKKKNITNQVDILLKNEDFLKVCEIVDHGYRLTNSQEKKLTENILKEINLYEEISKLLEKKYFVPIDVLISGVFDLKFKDMMSGENDDVSYPYLKKRYDILFETHYFSTLVYQKWKKSVNAMRGISRNDLQQRISKDHYTYAAYSKDNHLFKKAMAITEPYYMLKHQNINKVVSFIKTISDEANNPNATSDFSSEVYGYKHRFKEACDRILTEQQENILKDTKALFGGNSLKERTIKAQVEAMRNFDLSELPKNAQDTLKSIHELYNALSSQKLSLEDKMIIDNLCEQKVPEIIQKYASMHKDYRNTMVSVEGKTSAQLACDSLSDIKENLQSKLVTINENNLSDLSAVNRYTRRLN